METILANAGTKTRRATLHGREYLVAPATMIVPGVLPGSKGPLLYPADEVSRDPHVWNYIPLVLGHPTVNGEQVSAKDPGILDRFGLGMVLRPKINNGNLDAEAWFDVQQTRKVSPKLWNMLQAEQPIELSTGLQTDEEPIEGVHNTVAYRAIARNYRPDHLAILLDSAGACGRKDGCGVLVNEADDEDITWITISGNPVPIKDGTIQAGPFKGKEYKGDSRSDPKDPNTPRYWPRSADDRSKLAVEFDRLRTAAEDLQDVARVFTGHGNLRENGPVGGLARLGAGAIKAGVKVGGKAFQLLFRGVSRLNAKLGVNELAGPGLDFEAWANAKDETANDPREEGMALIRRALALCDTPEKVRNLVDAIEAAWDHDGEATENALGVEDSGTLSRFWRWLTENFGSMLGNGWITTDDGNHLFLSDKGELQISPDGRPVGKGDPDKNGADTGKNNPAPRKFYSDDSAIEKWGKEAYGSWKDSLTKDELQTVKDYQQTSDVNHVLRTGNPAGDYDQDSANEMAAKMDSIIDKAVLKEAVTVYRGVPGHVAEGWNVGSVIRDKGFTSTTLSEEQSQIYAVDTLKHKAVTLEITLPKGSHAVYAGAVQKSPDQEMILPRNASIKITGRDGQRYFATLVENTTTANAGKYGNPQSTVTGRYKHQGAGTGRGEVHEAAQRGALVLTDRDRELGKAAHAELQATGQNPASWVEDEDKWERAKAAADKGNYDGDAYWAVVSSVYQKMGGKIKSEVNNGAEREEEMTMALTQAQRQEHVKFLTTNCECWKKATPADRDTLNELSDEQLVLLKKSTEEALAARSVVNAAQRGFIWGGKRFAFQESGKVLVTNAKKMANNMDEEMVECEEGDKECEMEMEKAPPDKPTANQKRSIAERLTPEELQVFNSAVAIDKKLKAQLAGRLRAVAESSQDPRKQQLIGNKLKQNLSIGDLEDLLVLVGGPVANQRTEGDQEPTFYGSNPAYSLTDNEREDVLDIEEARKGYDPVIINKRRAAAV